MAANFVHGAGGALIVVHMDSSGAGHAKRGVTASVLSAGSDVQRALEEQLAEAAINTAAVEEVLQDVTTDSDRFNACGMALVLGDAAVDFAARTEIVLNGRWLDTPSVIYSPPFDITVTRRAIGTYKVKAIGLS